MKKIALIGGVLALGLTACGAPADEVSAKESDARARGFTITSSGSGGSSMMGGTYVYAHVVFGTNGKCNGTLWYNGDSVRLEASLPVPNSDRDVDFTINNPHAGELPETLVATSCFKP